VFLVLAATFFSASRTMADPDLWGHVRFGQDILASREIPQTDSYSYLSGGHPWINHEWLTEVIFGAFFSAFGVAGLIALKVSLILITLGIAYRHLGRQGLDPLRAGMAVLAVMFVMSAGLGTIRPQLFTYLLFAVMLAILHAAERGSVFALWCAPAVVLVWANLHGGFLAGVGLLAIWVLAHAILDRLPLGPLPQTPRLMLLVAALAASGIAALVNPYGAGLIAFLLRTATIARPEIGEWQGIAIISRQGAAYLVLLGVAVLAVVRSRRPRRPALLAALVCTALLPLQAVRHLPLFALAFAFLAAEHLADIWPRRANRQAGQAGKRPLLPAVALIAALVFVVQALPHFRCIRLDPSFMRFPARAVALLDRTGVEGNLATFFDWGEYILWHLSPRLRVSIDGRRETAYSDEAYRANMAFLFGAGDWDALLEATSIVLVPRGQPAYNLMKLKPGWSLVYEDTLSGIFARQGFAEADLIRRTTPPELCPGGENLCFP
jgi:hypothetical protein